MDKIESLNHTKWDCKYHIVFIPKGRRKVLYGQLRAHLGEVLRGLAQHKECWIEEGHLMPDHVGLDPFPRTHEGSWVQTRMGWGLGQGNRT